MDKYLDRTVNEYTARKILNQQKMDRLILDNKSLSLENQELQMRLKSIILLVSGKASTPQKRSTMPMIARTVNEKLGIDNNKSDKVINE